jgi:hypothetical protein
MPDYYKVNMLEIYKDDELIGYIEYSRKGCYFKPCSIDSDSDVEIDYDKYYEEKLEHIICDKDKVLYINNQWTSEFIKNKYIDTVFENVNSFSMVVKSQHTVMN